MRLCRLLTILLVCCFSLAAFGKDAPIAPIDWPSANPVLHFDILKTSKNSSYQNQNYYSIELAVKNVSQKRITNASFRLYLVDKHKIRIGDGWISITNLHPAETIKIQVNAQTLGTPAELSVVADRLPDELAYLAPPKLISTTVYSVPSGAKLRVDGELVGTTPISVKLAVGTHVLGFDKEGFSPGTFPMTVAADQLPGGSVTFELGGAQRDTVELRDGTVLTGDLQYINATEVVLQIGGNLQKYSRNLVKKVMLVEREMAAPQAN
jgi:hypothetical protein